MKKTTNIIYPVIAVCTFACLAFSTGAHAVTPGPDGGYPGGNTAEGQNALQSLTTGAKNTADGYLALFFNTSGRYNTATGAQALYGNTTGVANTANGMVALFHNTTGGDNTATGYGALYSNTSANHNTADGNQALYSNTTGVQNTAIGDRALYSNNTGVDNTANGYQALLHNTTGFENTADGSRALSGNTTGYDNTAAGFEALFSNTSGHNNTANGLDALFSNTTGYDNTATGTSALILNTSGNYNTALGYTALFSNTTGGQNTATGDGALYSNTGGSANTATGIEALYSNTSGIANTAVGDRALYHNTASGDTAIGDAAGSNLTTGSFNVCIGASVFGVAGESNTIRIADSLPTGSGQSACYIGGIAGQTVNPSGAGQVYIDNSGKLGVFLSSRRFKRDIKPMNKASEAILKLKPVTFRYKRDTKNAPCFGLIAEEVVKVNPDLVVRDKNGELLSVRYDQVNAMLLNEFLKEHRRVEGLRKDFQVTAAKQGAIIAQQQKRIDMLTARFDEQASLIQKVSTQLALRESASQSVANNR